jgi:hypothetical protein
MQSGRSEYAAGSQPASLSGWATFAAVLLLIAGAFNVMHGLVALNQSDYLINQLLYDNLDVWGWVFLAWGALQVLAGLMSFGTGSVGPAIGIGLASVATVLWFFMIFAAPFAAVLGFVVNIMIIYGLTTGRDASRAS